jgi:hypothetical protein
MSTVVKRLGIAACCGLAALGFNASASAQGMAAGGFQSGAARPLPTGVRSFAPNSSVGFSYSAYGQPSGSMTSSPSASMTSDYGNNSGYNPYGSYVLPDPFGGYLKGAADVIGAQGRYMINTQQAFQVKEQTRTLQIDNRRRMFDEWLYERANMPTLNDQREQLIRDEVRRSRNDPPLPEIYSAKALNDLLDDMQKLASRKVAGPNVPIDEDIIKMINVSAGGDSGNFGLLKNDGKITWPLGLRGLEATRELREELQSLIKKAYDEARDSKHVDPKTLQAIDNYSRQLEQRLVKNVGAVPFNQYMEAKAFLRQLGDAVRVFEKGRAGEYIKGNFALKGNNVGEMLEFMTKNGLRFAPATANEQRAYLALHRALVNYDVGANSAVVAERER